MGRIFLGCFSLSLARSATNEFWYLCVLWMMLYLYSAFPACALFRGQARPASSQFRPDLPTCPFLILVALVPPWIRYRRRTLLWSWLRFFYASGMAVFFAPLYGGSAGQTAFAFTRVSIVERCHGMWQALYRGWGCCCSALLIPQLVVPCRALRERFRFACSQNERESGRGLSCCSVLHKSR